jgi:hypothetical protein
MLGFHELNFVFPILDFLFVCLNVIFEFLVHVILGKLVAGVLIAVNCLMASAAFECRNVEIVSCGLLLAFLNELFEKSLGLVNFEGFFELIFYSFIGCNKLLVLRDKKLFLLFLAQNLCVFKLDNLIKFGYFLIKPVLFPEQSVSFSLYNFVLVLFLFKLSSRLENCLFVLNGFFVHQLFQISNHVTQVLILFVKSNRLFVLFIYFCLSACQDFLQLFVFLLAIF